MVFEDDMFHADPHPGNMFVEADGRLGLIDFGMVGMVDGEVRDHLASAVKAIIDRDVDTLLDSIVDMGAVAPEGSKADFRADLKHVMGHYPQLADFYLTTNLGEIFSVIRRNHVQLPANTFLLLKTMSMAQSLGKGLDPDFDFFEELKPYIEQIIQKRYSVSAAVRRLPSAVSDLVLLGGGLPKRLLRIIKSVERGEFHVGTNVEGLERHLEHLERIVRMMVLGILAAAIFLGMTILFLAFKISG
jgi:ubiquinone biosynthesis protein